MPDIAMCANALCPSAKKCYRFMAKPSEYRQSYFDDMAPEKGKKKCEYFMKDSRWRTKQG